MRFTPHGPHNFRTFRHNQISLNLYLAVEILPNDITDEGEDREGSEEREVGPSSNQKNNASVKHKSVRIPVFFW